MRVESMTTTHASGATTGDHTGDPPYGLKRSFDLCGSQAVKRFPSVITDTLYIPMSSPNE